MHRIFFALETDTALQTSIGEWVAASLPIDCKPVQLADLHVTLKFIGSVSDIQLPKIIEAVKEVSVPCFALTLDHVGYWEAPRVFWLAPSTQPQALLDLVSNLNQCLARHCEIPLDSRPYRPHITLARKVKVKPAIKLLSPMLLSAQSFSLMLSTTSSDGAKYQRIRAWPLQC